MKGSKTRAVPSSTAVITGASRGIGAAFARRLAAEGCDVTLVARQAPELVELAEELSQRFQVRADVVVADLSTPGGVDVVVRRLADSAPHWLINNAGFGVPGAFDQVALDQSLTMIQLHVMAGVRLSHAASAGMIDRGHGRIVNITSIGAFLPRPGDAT